MGFKNKIRVLIAGTGGGSLGMEIFKSLRLAGRYTIYGADTSPYAFGLYQKGFVKTFRIDSQGYIQNIFKICYQNNIQALIPGAGPPLDLIIKSEKLFRNHGIVLGTNERRIVELEYDKAKEFAVLKKLGIPIPLTRKITTLNDLKGFSYPCVIKPSEGSGGSVFAYVAEDKNEARVFADYLLGRGIPPIAQEYLSIEGGEYSVAVLHLPDGNLAGSIALKKVFPAKLSISLKTKSAILSSPYSQGLIAEHREVRRQAEVIAAALDSRGPLNVQGRMKNGIFYPFELNGRFSGGMYLRALAGFNDIDVFLQNVIYGANPQSTQLRRGYYLRSLTEIFVPERDVKK